MFPEPAAGPSTFNVAPISPESEFGVATIADNDDPNDQISEAADPGTLDTTLSATENVTLVREVDLYAFSVRNGDEVRIEISSQTSGFTPRVRGFGPRFGRPAEPLDPTTGATDNTFTFTATESTTYHVGPSEISNQFYNVQNGICARHIRWSSEPTNPN